MEEYTVDGLMLFTRLLDGKGIYKCVCSFIWRGDNKENCPSCGRNAKHSEPESELNYKISKNITILT